MSKRVQKADEWQKSKVVKTYFTLGLIEGVAALAASLLAPSDVENRLFLGYSAARIAIIAVILILLAVFTGLTIKSYTDQPWLDKLARTLLGKKTTIPNLFVAVFITFLAVLGTALIFKPAWLLQLASLQLGRIYPIVVWIILLVVELACVWAWVWTSRRVSISTKSIDWVVAGILFVTAFMPRAILTGYGLPYQSVWDEVVTYPQALRMLTVPGLKPYTNVPGYGQASYGDLLVYLTTGGEVLGLLDGFRTQQISSVQEFVSPPQGVSSINGAVNESGIPLRYPRLLLALINSLAPVLIFIGLRKYLKTDVFSAFAGGLLFAVLSREVMYYSSYILPDALAATIFMGMLLTAFACIDDEKGRVWPYFLCSFLGGLILSTNLRLYTVVIVPFIALALARHRQHLPARLFSIPVGLAVGFFITSPYTLIDLPNMLSKWTSFSWYHELSLRHRLSSLIYYAQGMFQAGFNSSYIDTNEGSIGFGILAGIVALLGLGKLLVRQTRYAILILVFTVFQLYSITPIVQRYTRHALVLYPLVCLVVGMGLSLAADGILAGIQRLKASNKAAVLKKTSMSGLTRPNMIAAIVLIIFLVFNIKQFSYSFTYLRRVTHYQTSQMQAEAYLSQTIQPGDKVGVLDIVPWVESDLQGAHIPYERITLNDTPQALAERGITLVAGTDRIGGDYGTTTGTMWANGFQTDGSKLAEFGSSALEYEGYPTNNLYLFVARLPGG